MENQEGHNQSLESSASNEVRMYKSNLFQASQNAQKIFDYLSEGVELEEWMKSHIVSASEELNQVRQSLEYDKAYPEKNDPTPNTEEDGGGENNFLSNEDKRYPVPQEAEGGDQFMGRCIADANMKKRYPVQSDRFMACMLILNSNVENPADNPGEKFEDPMNPEEEILDPDRPIMP